MDEGKACAFGEGDGFADADGRAVRVESDGVLGDVACVAGVGQTEQQCGLGVDGTADKGFRRAVLEDAAFVHDGDGVGHGAGFFGGVGHEDGGDVLTADAFGSQGAQVVAQVGVEAGEGFVQEQQRRARDEGAREGEALLFAAGEAFGFALRFVFQTDVAQGLHGLFFDVGFGQTAHFEAEADVVEGRQVRQKGVVLKHQRDIAFFRRHVGDVVAVEPDFAAVWTHQTDDGFEQGGFAAAGAAEYGEDFACFDV